MRKVRHEEGKEGWKSIQSLTNLCHSARSRSSCMHVPVACSLFIKNNAKLSGLDASKPNPLPLPVVISETH